MTNPSSQTRRGLQSSTDSIRAVSASGLLASYLRPDCCISLLRGSYNDGCSEWTGRERPGIHARQPPRRCGQLPEHQAAHRAADRLRARDRPARSTCPAGSPTSWPRANSTSASSRSSSTSAARRLHRRPGHRHRLARAGAERHAVQPRAVAGDSPVALDEGSRTSAALTQILLRKRHGVNARRPAAADRRPRRGRHDRRGAADRRPGDAGLPAGLPLRLRPRPGVDRAGPACRSSTPSGRCAAASNSARPRHAFHRAKERGLARAGRDRRARGRRRWASTPASAAATSTRSSASTSARENWRGCGSTSELAAELGLVPAKREGGTRLTRPRVHADKRASEDRRAIRRARSLGSHEP